MPSDDRQLDRRSVLKTSGLAFSGLLGASGITAGKPGRGRSSGRDQSGNRGPPERANAPAWVSIENDRLEMTMSKAEWDAAPAASEIDAVPDNAKKLSYDDIINGVDELNEAAENGRVEFGKPDTRQGLKVHTAGHQGNRRDD